MGKRFRGTYTILLRGSGGCLGLRVHNKLHRGELGLSCERTLNLKDLV